LDAVLVVGVIPLADVPVDTAAAAVRELLRELLAKACEFLAPAWVLLARPRAMDVFVRIAEVLVWAEAVECDARGALKDRWAPEK
jgi:hypothetical protein